LCLNSLNSDAPSPLTVICVTGLPAASVTTQVRLVVNSVGGQVNGLGEDDVVLICGVMTYLTLSPAGAVGVVVLVTCEKTDYALGNWLSSNALFGESFGCNPELPQRRISI
jgi:hypothetical protein